MVSPLGSPTANWVGSAIGLQMSGIRPTDCNRLYKSVCLHKKAEIAHVKVLRSSGRPLVDLDMPISGLWIVGTFHLDRSLRIFKSTEVTNDFTPRVASDVRGRDFINPRDGPWTCN